MTIHRIAAGIATAIVIVAIVAGLYLAGSPSQQRLLRIDDRRLDDLRRLTRAIDEYASETGRLPATIEVLADGRRLDAVPADPVSGQPYVFEPLGADRYRLCAEFAQPAPAQLQGEFWAHPAGPACFDFRVQPAQRTRDTR